MSPVIDVEVDSVTPAVGNESVVAEVGKERRSGLVEFGAANDQALALVVGLSDLGLTVHGVVD